ncbi:MAG TPA: response regulator [Terriglobia bacterium]|nr:response regulator [Terriglobia bacterium]
MPRDREVPGKEVKPVARILLIDDNTADVLLLEKALQAHDISYELIRYLDGENAMRALAQGHTAVPDVILVDLNLPRRDGFDVLSAVRKTPRLAGVPVGVLTSSNAAKDRNRAALIGVEKYICKPPTLDEFINEVGRGVQELLLMSAPGDASAENSRLS